jgi:hypothetical protein
LEGVLLNHPDVADAGVVGVEVDGLELPRAYVVLKKPTKDVAAQRLVANEIQEWVNPRVGKPKQLRGGVAIILEIPKRSVVCSCALFCELRLTLGRFLLVRPGRSFEGYSKNAPQRRFSRLARNFEKSRLVSDCIAVLCLLLSSACLPPSRSKRDVGPPLNAHHPRTQVIYLSFKSFTGLALPHLADFMTARVE